MRSKLLIIPLIIILVAVYYFLGMDYSKQRKEQEALTSQIIEVTQTLRQIPQPPCDLEQRLAAAQASLAAEQSTFPDNINSTEVIDTILELADNSKVNIISLVTQPWSAEVVGEHDYYVFRLNIAVMGEFPQLLTYLNKLEKGDYTTLIIEALNVTRVTGQPEEEAIPEKALLISANLKLAIYSYSTISD